MNSFFTSRLLYTLIFVFLASTLLAKQEKRVALIWGNSDYHGWSPLPSCKNDAEAIKKTLESLGFDTEMQIDLNREEMNTKLDLFIKEKAKDADVAVFFYSGHAFVYDYNYYLVPAKTELDPNPKYLLSNSYYKSDDILNKLRVNSRLCILFFDACRNTINIEGETKGGMYQTDVVDENWFSSTQSTPDEKIPTGCKICYSAGIREMARVKLENDSLSPFTRVLTNHLKDGYEFRTVWKTIQKEVSSITDNKQHPRDEESYSHDFYFNQKNDTKPQVSEKQTKPKTQKMISFIVHVPITTAPTIVINGEEFETKYDKEKKHFYKQLFFEQDNIYNYLIQAKGYKTHSDRITVTSNTPKTSNLEISLNEIKTAQLQFNSIPEAEVFLDGYYFGKTPLKIDTTYAGEHTIYLYANGFEEYYDIINLEPGFNHIFKTLKNNKTWFLDIDKNNKATHLISYSYSPEYQYGLDFLYRLKKSRFSLGLHLAVSPSFFRGINFSPTNIDTPVSTSVDGVIVIDGELTQYTQTTTTSVPSEYSKAIDPYDVAKFYNSNLLVLLNSGFNICNGVMIEAGVGAASNQQKIKMPYFITYQKIVKTNKITGERIGIQEAKTIKNDVVKWYKGDTKWSPATRIGLRTFIPIKSNRFSISLGGGYTFVITNFDYSSWDANIGICFTK